jgi:hypothetical protein
MIGAGNTVKNPKSKTFSKIATAYHQLKAGGRPRVTGDGSIPTTPCVSVVEQPEAAVLEECLDWLKRNRIWVRRMNVGKGTLGRTGFFTYGIIGSADITGLLRNGRRLEIETKAGKGGRLSVDQQRFRQDIIDNNGVYLIVHGVEELEFLMKGVL